MHWCVGLIAQQLTAASCVAAVARSRRLAEFSAYCLSFCFVASLYYMVSWQRYRRY